MDDSPTRLAWREGWLSEASTTSHSTRYSEGKAKQTVVNKLQSSKGDM